MRFKHLLASAGAAALLSSFAGGVGAQRTVPMQPGHPTSSKMGGMMGQRGRQPMMGGGQIIGNKNTKVYHLAGDKGNMPAEKNRVYFRTEREATAAGYHAAGTKKTTKMSAPGMSGRMRHPMTGSTTHMPGQMRHPMTGTTTDLPGRTNGAGGHLQK